MSKYKVNFYASTRYVGAEVEEDVDLIEDYGFSEEKAKKIFEDEDKLQEIFNEWLFENIDAGWKRLEEE
ncbi:DUF7167 family protein [Fusobacterium necrophorum]|uniref:DUF7167 domain-containing protein n=2 Tax=Fusobacterium necrophorum TaxID=859 RepID=A0AAN3VX34_9FUSO|nr:hypothetical protein [Fusobacterium necrophorum]AYV94726.1 hypothetical protein BWX37_03435 [Fusobacterium necrophorum subsp. funduliforme]EJU18738.1 hypothetical protein HMPREF1127_1044 [Fusobacterium necrophorum subsp. funduliforme Fnf 1007]KYL02971.1 hypothetical protein A2J06_09940 [Fusobacterium necrophorum subsp. funduliforme]KYM37705.1 hypothetical protein A2U03_10835 [Fusobacterium necrophorum subsp. funduliforme]KYM52216.1 hypothetical protein A2U04_10375 [Fusobacterium necrophorum